MDAKCVDAGNGMLLPLCVDLDGTLVKTDTLVESFVAAMRDWHLLIRIPGWLLRGKATLKSKLVEKSKPNPALLPYNETVLEYLAEEKKRGRKLVLVTAANQNVAEVINQHLGIFDEVIASNEARNLRGEEKAKELVKRYGNRHFSYMGNDRADLNVWRVAQSAILVNTTKSLTKRAAEITKIETRLSQRPRQTKAILRELRPYQWVKNLLVFIPIVAANAFGDLSAWFYAGLTFMAFCATASGIYVINDLFDLEADRQHPIKRNRPFASGTLPLTVGFAIAPILLLSGLVLAINSKVLLIILCYATISITYSAKLKKMPLVDVFTLAGLYTIRLYAGGEASGYHVSMWLIAFSAFLFLSLALVKRVSELKLVMKGDGQSATRRDYMNKDLDVLQSMGIGSSFISSLVLALYVQSDAAVDLYANPRILWGIVPVILFWQCRLWLSTARGYMREDPILYAAQDWVSWLVGLVLLIIMVTANIQP